MDRLGSGVELRTVEIETMSVIVKICGLTTETDIECAIQQGADYVGFIFYPPSPRHIEPDAANLLMERINFKGVKRVAVVVDADDALLDAIVKQCDPGMLQLHGKESVERIKEIKARYQKPIMKAIAVENGDDIAKGLQYTEHVDMLLFDTKVPKHISHLPGGTGMRFDWKLLENRDFTVPWLISGGITHENVKKALAISGASGVDVSSGVEVRPGIKSPQLIEEFLKTVKT